MSTSSNSKRPPSGRFDIHPRNHHVSEKIVDIEGLGHKVIYRVSNTGKDEVTVRPDNISRKDIDVPANQARDVTFAKHLYIAVSHDEHAIGSYDFIAMAPKNPE